MTIEQVAKNIAIEDLKLSNNIEDALKNAGFLNVFEVSSKKAEFFSKELYFTEDDIEELIDKIRAEIPSGYHFFFPLIRIKSPYVPDNRELLFYNSEEIFLSGRAAKELSKNGIKTFYQLLQTPSSQLHSLCHLSYDLEQEVIQYAVSEACRQGIDIDSFPFVSNEFFLNIPYEASKISFDELNLSSRLKKRISAIDLQYLGDLNGLSLNNFLSIDGFGEKSKKELFLNDLINELIVYCCNKNAYEKYFGNSIDAILIAENNPTHIFPFADVSEKIAAFKIKDSAFSPRVINSLMRGGFECFGDLRDFSLADIKLECPGFGQKCADELLKDLPRIIGGIENPDTYSKYDCISDFIHDVVNERNAELFDLLYQSKCSKRSGKIDFDDLGITRQRIYQINSKILDKIRRAFETHNIKHDVFRTIDKYLDNPFHECKLGDLPEFSLDRKYSNESVLIMLTDIYPNRISICRDYRLGELWLEKEDGGISTKVSEVIDYVRENDLEYTFEKVCNDTNANPELVKDIKQIHLHQGICSLMQSDKLATILLYMREVGRPVSLDELSSLTGYDTHNLGSSMAHLKEVVNVGKSTYALISNGFKDKPTRDIIYEYIDNIGHPVKKSDIIDHVLLYKLISPGSVLASLTVNEDYYYKTDDGKIALAKWGLPKRVRQGRSFYISTEEAVLFILDEFKTPMSNRKLLDHINKKYGDDATSSIATIAATTSKLYNDGKVGRILHPSNFYEYYIQK